MLQVASGGQLGHKTGEYCFVKRFLVEPCSFWGWGEILDLKAETHIGYILQGREICFKAKAEGHAQP